LIDIEVIFEKEKKLFEAIEYEYKYMHTILLEMEDDKVAL